MEKNYLQQRVKDICARLVLVDPLARGHSVWLRLNEKLPDVVGAKINDEPRLQKFKHEVKSLSFLDFWSLKKWLQYEHGKLKDDWDKTEIFSSSVEQHCIKWLQIYGEHLEVL